MIAQGDVWWADLGKPLGSAPGYRRPVLVVQCDAFNESRIATVLCVPLTGTLRLTNRPGNTLLVAGDTGLDRDSVASGSLTPALDRSQLFEHVGLIPRRALERVLAGIDVVLGR